jgi:large subunit ribosomal protein L13
MKSYIAKDLGQERRWVVVDAAGKTLGRLSVQIANVLRGKDLPTFTPHVDTGAFVVVVNADQVKLTGRKEENKIYQRYTGWRGGQRETTAAVVRERHPERIIELAVRGMLPKNNLARKQLKRLKVYAGAEHPHDAQLPEAVELV